MDGNLLTLPAGKARVLVQALLSTPEAPPVMLWGPPGVGKSSVVRQAAAAAGLPVREVRAAYRNPVDVAGLPAPGPDGLAVWLQSAVWPRAERDGEKGLLFLDEITNAPRLVQGALYELILDRRIEDYRLPEGWRVAAAGNRVEDRAAANPMPTALANRLLHVVVDPTVEDWAVWAWRAGIAEEIIAYLHYRPENLLVLPPAGTDCPAFPTPRSWEMASRVWDLARSWEERRMLVSAAVGVAAATEAVEFARAREEVPDPEEVLRGAKPRFPAKPDRAYLFAAALVAAVKRDPAPAKVANAVKYTAAAAPVEFQVMIFRALALLPAAKPHMKVPEFAKWCREHKQVLLSVLDEEIRRKEGAA